MTALPTDKKLRKKFPIGTGFLDYFPDAVAAVSYVSYVGNAQHNGPDSPLHWSRGKSDDHEDTVIRHFIERGGFDVDGTRHSAKFAWRALAVLQLEIEAARAKGEPGICAEDETLLPGGLTPYSEEQVADVVSHMCRSDREEHQRDYVGSVDVTQEKPVNAAKPRPNDNANCGISGEH